jgi:hypothetical protein
MLRLAAIGIPLLPLVAAYEWYDVNNQPTSPWQAGQIGVSHSYLFIQLSVGFSGYRTPSILGLCIDTLGLLFNSTTLVEPMTHQIRCESAFVAILRGR